MNNASFRSLVNTSATVTSKVDKDGSRRTPSSMLGSRSRSSIPMTPRSLNASKTNLTSLAGRTDTEQTTSDPREPPNKKLKLNSVPKGSKFGSGYVDRSAERRAQDLAEDEDVDKQKRLKALEVMLKKDEIDQGTFEHLRAELGIGGDTSSTHLVKGLDWKLLERVRKGEDVSKQEEAKTETTDVGSYREQHSEENVDDELERALERKMSSPLPVADDADHENQERDSTDQQAQQTLSRDEILRRLKENRKNPHTAQGTAVAASVPPKLSSHFKKITSTPKVGKHKFTESINGRRREVLVITKKDGSTKRKTRWIDPENAAGKAEDKGTVGGVLGGDIDEGDLARQRAYEAEQKRIAEEEVEDDDIFGGVAEYDPLAGLDDEPDNGAQKRTTIDNALEDQSESAKPRDYFAVNQEDAESSDTRDKEDPAHDPAILAALKRAAQIRRQEEDDGKAQPSDDEDDNQPSDREGLAKRQAFLKSLKDRDRQDALDIDMRFDEDEDEEGPIYDDLGDGDGDDHPRGGKGQRKRGGKKKKGDKNNARDVLDVLEGRKTKD